MGSQHDNMTALYGSHVQTHGCLAVNPRPKYYPQVLYFSAHTSTVEGFLSPMISLGASFCRAILWGQVVWALSGGHCFALSSSAAPPVALPAVHSCSP